MINRVFKRKFQTVVLLGLVTGLGLLACQSKYIANTPHDVGVKPNNTRHLTINTLQKILANPETVLDLEVGEVFLGSCSLGLYGTYYAWVIPATFNVKEKSGRFSGIKTRYLWFHGDDYQGQSWNLGGCDQIQ